MSPQKTHKPSIAKAYDTVIKSLKKHPALFLPFVILFIFDIAALVALYLAPRVPFIKIFGPPIRTLWSERFLHYPLNFLLLPKLSGLARMGLSIVLGSLLTGMAVAIIYDIFNNKKIIKLGGAFKVALKKYLYLFLVVFIFTMLFYFLTKLIPRGLIYYFIKTGHKRLLFLEAKFWIGPMLLYINFLLAILIQSAFVYVIPLIIIGKEKFLKSIWRSFILFKRLFVPTLLLVTLPTILFIPILILQQNIGFLIYRVCPESVLLLLAFESFIASLVIDPLITLTAAVLYLSNKENT